MNVLTMRGRPGAAPEKREAIKPLFFALIEKSPVDWRLRAIDAAKVAQHDERSPS